jgi:hypothetical protein
MSKDPVFIRENLLASEHTSYRERNRHGTVSSIIYGGHSAPQHVVKKASTYITSEDNPLFVPGEISRPAGWRVRPPPAPTARPEGVAGKPQCRSVPLGSVMTGVDALPPGAPSSRLSDRTLSMASFPPNYRVHPSTSDTGVKALLYPSEPAPAPSASGAEEEAGAAASAPMLYAAFAALRERFSQVPRDEAENIDEAFARSLLEEFGFDLSIDGFAEFLARCDVSGFPSFQHFVGCTLRSHRQDPCKPPSAPLCAAQVALSKEFDEPTNGGLEGGMGHPELLSEDSISALEGMGRDLSLELAPAPTPPFPSQSTPVLAIAEAASQPQHSPSEHMQRSWRYMQHVENMPTVRIALSEHAPTSSMPLGSKSGIVPIGSNLPFSNSFGTYGRSASISKGHSVDRYF